MRLALLMVFWGGCFFTHRTFFKKVIRLHYIWTNLLAAEENVLCLVTAKAQTSKHKEAYCPTPVGKMYFIKLYGCLMQFFLI